MPIISPKIPQGLEELMRGLAKSVIKENPENIYEFAAEYFENLLRERDGTVDQSYKKFATYKVYKKSKLERRKRERDDNLNSDQSSTGTALILPDSMSSSPPKRVLSKDCVSIGSESEINAATIVEAPNAEDEGTPGKESVNSQDNDEIENIVLDDEMAHAALKIQSTFRGHKVRRGMKEQMASDVGNEEEQSEIETTGEMEAEDEDKLREIECEETPVTAAVAASSSDGATENAPVEAAPHDGESKRINEQDDSEAIENTADESFCDETVQPVESPLNEECNTISNERSIELNEGEKSEIAAQAEIEIGTEESQNDAAAAAAEEELANMLTDPDIAQATLKIQSAYRGHRVRRNVKSDTQMTEEEEVEEGHDAAVVSNDDEVTAATNESSNLHEIQANEERAAGLETATMSPDESPAPDDSDEKLSELNLDNNATGCSEALEQDLISETLVPECTEVEPLERENENNLNTDLATVSHEEEEKNSIVSEISKETEAGLVEDKNQQNTQGSVEANAFKRADNIPSDIREQSSRDTNEEMEKVVVETANDEDEGPHATDFDSTTARAMEECEPAEELSRNIVTEHETVVTASSSAAIEEAVGDEINLEAQEQVVEGELQASVDNTQLPQVSEEKCYEQQMDVDETKEAADENDEAKEVEEENDEAKSVEEDVCEQKIISYLEPTEDGEAAMSGGESMKTSLEKMSSTDIKYEQLRESIDHEQQQSPVHAEDSVEKNETTNENSIDNDSLPEENKSDREQCDSQQGITAGEPMRKLENILQTSVSPYNLIDEVVNEAATRKVAEIFPNQSAFENKSGDDLDKIINPGLISLENEDACNGKGEESDINSKSMDEILKPEKEESEIPEEEPQALLDSNLQMTEQSNERADDDDISGIALDDPELQDAAAKIQAAFRGHQVRREKESEATVESGNEQAPEELDDLPPLDDPELQDAAVKIQAAFRGHQIRRDRDATTKSVELSKEQLVDDFSDLPPLDDAELQDAAVKIQAAYRGHQVRRDRDATTKSVELSKEQLADDFSDLPPLDNAELQDAAVKIQAAYRGHQVRRDKEIVKSPELSKEAPCLDDDVAQMALDDCELQEAATKIQAAFRGHQVRKDKENITTPQISVSEVNEVANMVIDDVMEEAAVKIQAVYRGHQVRKEKIVKFNSENSNQDESEQRKLDSTFVIEQCSEGNEEAQDQDETEQQDTSADVDEIQESENTEHENNEEEESHEEETIEQETETNEEGGGDDPNEPEQAEGESSGQQPNEDDDVANMVLDDEMAQAALKIQSTFRGHKSRMDTKSQQDCKAAELEEEQKQQAALDEELASMLLDPEIADATLKIQSVFRGQKARKEVKEKEIDGDDDDEQTPKKEEEEEEKKDEPQPEQSSSSSSTEKSAQQLQEEEDIANLVMDDEMEKTALKIQSAFRGKIKRKPKDGAESYESSTEDNNGDKTEGEAKEEEEEEEEGEADDFQKSDEQPQDIYEYFSMSNEYSHDEVDHGYLANRQSYADDTRRFEVCTAFDQTIYPEDDDIHLMHGGGIFVEPSGEDPCALDPQVANLGQDGEENNDDEDDERKIIRKQQSSTLDEDAREDSSIEKVKSEMEAIESFDFKSNKDSAEAMYYSLKKNEIEAQKRFEINNVQQQETLDDYSSKEVYATESMELDEDDDDVVVIKTPPSAANSKMLKYRMSMDDSILSQDYARQKARNNEQLEKVHEMSQSGDDDDDDGVNNNNNNADYSNDIVDEDEDQFDDFYPGNIRSKIMASSISIADSDYFDPTNNKSIIDDDTIRTALETIHSTDSESTIGSAATKIQVNDKNLTSRRNNNFQYSSIGNAAIDKSLDDFIQSQELRIDRFEEEPEGYSSPPPKKHESCDDYTDDTCTESDPRKIAGVIEIKLEQKHFLTVDERRRTLHREDAIQRNSTRSVEDESSKSSSTPSGEKNVDKIHSQNDAAATASEAAAAIGVQGQNSIIDTEIAVPVLEKQKSAIAIKNVKVPMRRQKTMPVQIESNVIRVLPKHLRKRIRSAESEKKKRFSK